MSDPNTNSNVYEVHNTGHYDAQGYFYQEHLGYVTADTPSDALEQAHEDFNPDAEVTISYYHPDYEG